jgi:Bacterial lectin
MARPSSFVLLAAAAVATSMMLCSTIIIAADTYNFKFQLDSMCDLGYAPVTLTGNALKTGPHVLVTEPGKDQTGAMFSRELVPVANGFRTTFKFLIDGVTNGGADGLAFVVQAVSDVYTGHDASGLGYGGMSDAIALEFDTYQNVDYKDPDNNHVSLHIPNTKSAALSPNEDGVYGRPFTSQVPFRDAKEHIAEVVYDAVAHTVTLTLDNSEIHTWNNVNLGDLMDMDGPNKDSAFVGFTAATGGAYEQHSIHSWSYEVPGTVTTCMDSAAFDINNACKQSTPAIDDCANIPSCTQCGTSMTCCGWCADGCKSAANVDTKTMCSGAAAAFVCDAGKSHTVLWWGIGIVIAVLILCAVALFIYWKRTRVQHRFTDASLLGGDDDVVESDTYNSSGDAQQQYTQL